MRRIPAMTFLGLGLGAAVGSHGIGAESRYLFTEGAERAEVVVDLGNLSDFTVPATLFGKFTENLGRNVYGGFWAQTLENPSLEPIENCVGRAGYAPWERLAVTELAHRDPFRDGDQKVLAYGWFRWNGDMTEYAFARDAYNGMHCQALTVNGLAPDTIGAGICQAVYLPTRRTLRYRLRLAARDTDAELVAAIAEARHPERCLAVALLEPVAGSSWEIRTARFELNLKDEDRSPRPMVLCIGIAGRGTAHLDQITLLPDDAIPIDGRGPRAELTGSVEEAAGFDPEVVALLKASRVRMLRFPGGNYASGYHWKNGLGTIDERPTMKNPAWPHSDPHHVGIDEHIALCRLIGAEPLICVNAGDGSPQEAAEWVEYCNGSPETPWGARRAERGHPEPYDVRYWEVGNELWGSWQIGHCTPEEYAIRYRAFHDAMRRADPSIRLIACGQKGDISPGWTDVLLDRCGDIVDCMSVHLLFYNDIHAAPDFSFLSRMGYSCLVEDLFRSIHARGLDRGIDLEVAITENLLPSSRGCQAGEDTMAEALSYAGILNAAIRTEGIVPIFTHSAIVNHGGGLRKHFGVVYPNPVYHARSALQALEGGRPAAFDALVPFADVPQWQPSWAGPEPRRFPLVDVLPALRDGVLTIVFVNRHPARPFPVNVSLRSGASSSRSAQMFELSGHSYHAMNDPVAPDRVRPRRGVLPLGDPASFRLMLRAASLTLVTVDLQPLPSGNGS